MTARSIAISAAALTFLLTGCAENGTLSTGLNTGSVNPQAAAQNKSTEALCLTLTAQIEALNTEGVPDKVAKAAAKKYKLKAADIAKADELNKANTEFQTKCSSYPPRVTTTTAAAEPAKDAATTKTAANTKPPVPSQKPLAAALAPQETTQAPSAPAGATAPSP